MLTMARQNALSTQRDKTQLLNSFRKPTRNQISGWDGNKSEWDDTDIVSWMKQVPGKGLKEQDSDKEDDSGNESGYRVKLTKCPTIGNVALFQTESLHARFTERPESPPTANFKQKPGYLVITPTAKKNENDEETGSKLNCERKAFSDGDNVSTTELVDDKTNLKLDLKSGNDAENYLEALRRSRSVPVSRSARLDMARTKRLLKFAKHTNANDINYARKIYDDDEGYASKTSSAEDQMTKATHDPYLHIIGMRSTQMNATDALLNSSLLMVNPKYARFSYTHQNEKIHSNPNTPRLLGAGVLEQEKYNAGNLYKFHDRGHLYHYRSTSEIPFVCTLEDPRPVSLVLKKITMQTPHSEPKQGETKTSAMPEWIPKNSSDTNPIQTTRKFKVEGGNNTKREQYPIHNTSPELKFGIQTRISPTKMPYKDIGESGKSSSIRSDYQESENHPNHAVETDTHSSLPLPLSDLLPAVDRSIRYNQTLRNPDVCRLHPLLLETNGQKCKGLMTKEYGSEYTFPCAETKHALLKSSTDLLGRTLGQCIGPPSFRAHRQKSPLQRAKDNTDRRLGTGIKLSKESSEIAPPLINQRQQHGPRMRMVTTKVKSGSESGLKLPINPERGKRRRMEETFLKFYNGKCPHELHCALTEEMNFMLNAT